MPAAGQVVDSAGENDGGEGMSDITQKARALAMVCDRRGLGETAATMRDCADEIERLRADNRRLRTALAGRLHLGRCLTRKRWTRKRKERE